MRDFCKEENHLKIIEDLMNTSYKDEVKIKALESELTQLKLQNVGLVLGLKKIAVYDALKIDGWELLQIRTLANEALQLYSSDTKLEESV